MGDQVLGDGESTTSQGSVTLPSAIDQLSVAEDEAAVAGTDPVWGEPAVLVPGRLRDLRAEYDGGTELSALWELPVTGPADGARVDVLDATGARVAGAVLPAAGAAVWQAEEHPNTTNAGWSVSLVLSSDLPGQTSKPLLILSRLAHTPPRH